MGKQKKNLKTKSPERLSGHELVNYLIADPGARGNFKYHTLLSCMWRNLLIAQPGFEDVAEFGKINHRDICRILLERPRLAPRFDFSKLHDAELRLIFLEHPELATPETTASLVTAAWSEILRKHPQLAPLCPFKKFYPYNWIYLISGQISFAEQCPWHTFMPYDWRRMIGKKKSCLQFLKLEYLDSAESLRKILENCYFGETLSYKGAFEQGIQDTASFLICKRMDRENGKRYLKKQIQKDNWEFVEELCTFSPEEAMDVHGKKYMPFYMTLAAPDQIFEKLFPLLDLTVKDSGGNTLLLAALVRGLCKNDMTRYNFLLEKGMDPDEKNIAGFSCNDLVDHLEKEKLRQEAARAARIERAQKRKKQAMKGNTNVR